MSTVAQPSFLDLLPSETLGRLSKLQLLARGTVEGNIAGKHQSPYKGASAEFAEHRPYVPGDDIRTLDWRVFGRNDRYYIKQYVEETNLRATIVLDCSGSMQFTGEHAEQVNGKRLSKFEYAQYVSASLAYLLIQQQDAVGLVRFDSEIRGYIPARSRPTHLHVLTKDIYEADCGAETSLGSVLQKMAERVPRRGLLLVVSDLMADPAEIVKALSHLRFRKHEVVLFHVLAEEELTFPYQQWGRFQSLEQASQEIQLDPKAVRAEYLQRLKAYLSEIKLACGQLQIEHVPMNTKLPYAATLSDFLARRMERSR